MRFYMLHNEDGTYSTERVQWWVDRSKSPDHQKAYDWLASFISPAKDRIVVDHCCGNAELIKRIYHRCAARASPNDFLIVGTDMSHETLLLAVDNLSKSGVNAGILRDATNLTRHRGVVLLEDNLSDSIIPAEVSDFSFLTFPEIALKGGTQAVINVLSKHNPADPRDLADHLATYELSRITRRKGQAVLCDYSEFGGRASTFEKNYLGREAKLAKMFGLNLRGAPFVECKNIYNDISSEERSKFATSGKKKGYRALLYIKN